jgi:hypothetical protein
VNYFVNGGATELRLPDAMAEWFNPRNGEVIRQWSIEGGKTGFSAPDNDDWILYIRASRI